MSIATFFVCQEGIVLGCDSRITVSKDTPYAKAGTYDNGEKFLLYKNYGITCCGDLDVSFNNQYITWKDIVKNAIDTGKSFGDIVDHITDTLAKYNMIKTQMIIANASLRKIARIEFNLNVVTYSSDYFIGNGIVQSYNSIDADTFFKDIISHYPNISFVEDMVSLFINKNIEICNLLSEIKSQVPVIGGKARTLSLCFNGSCRIDGVPV